MNEVAENIAEQKRDLARFADLIMKTATRPRRMAGIGGLITISQSKYLPPGVGLFGYPSDPAGAVWIRFDDEPAQIGHA